MSGWVILIDGLATARTEIVFTYTADVIAPVIFHNGATTGRTVSDPALIYRELDIANQRFLVFFLESLWTWLPFAMLSVADCADDFTTGVSLAPEENRHLHSSRDFFGIAAERTHNHSDARAAKLSDLLNIGPSVVELASEELLTKDVIREDILTVGVNRTVDNRLSEGDSLENMIMEARSADAVCRIVATLHHVAGGDVLSHADGTAGQPTELRVALIFRCLRTRRRGGARARVGGVAVRRVYGREWDENGRRRRRRRRR